MLLFLDDDDDNDDGNDDDDDDDGGGGGSRKAYRPKMGDHLLPASTRRSLISFFSTEPSSPEADRPAA